MKIKYINLVVNCTYSLNAGCGDGDRGFGDFDFLHRNNRLSFESG